MVSVLVCDKIHEEGIEILDKLGLKVDLKLNLKPDELMNVIKDYDGVIVRSKTKITKEVIERAPKLKVIARAGVGLDNIDVEAAKKRGITVLNAAEAVIQSTAELAIGLMLCVNRLIPCADASVKKGEWIKGQLRGRQLMGKTLGIIGFGRIGSRVAKLAKAIGMRVLVYDIALDEQLAKELDVAPTSLERLLQQSDMISLHVPLTPETKHLLGDPEFSQMRDGVIIINTSRGSVIDDQALYKALKSGKVGGVGLDVYSVEPPQNLELLQSTNVVCTPHIGAQTEEAQREASILVAEKVAEALKPGRL